MNTKTVTRLFDENDHYTDCGMDLDCEVAEALHPIIEKYHSAGYSMRDVAYIIEGTVTCLTLGKII